MVLLVEAKPAGLDVHTTVLSVSLVNVTEMVVLPAAPTQRITLPLEEEMVGNGLTVKATGIRLLIQPLLLIST